MKYVKRREQLRGKVTRAMRKVFRAAKRTGLPILCIEIFAGKAGLTAAVRKMGVSTADPQDWKTGGVDLLDDAAFQQLLDFWERARIGVDQLVFHLGTDCTSFARVRDRSTKTRLRSKIWPWGFDKEEHVTAQGNRLARRTAEIVRWMTDRGATGSIENPVGSYLWQVLGELLYDLDWQDVFLTYCMYGRPYRKATQLRTFGDLDLRPLSRVCKRRAGKLSCGRAEHEILEFGGRSTSEASVYPPQLCRAWARLINKHALRHSARDRLGLTSSGVVHRHSDR